MRANEKVVERIAGARPWLVDIEVVATGITPAFNSGIAHVRAGIGQIGAGHGRVPMACFGRAAEQLAPAGHA